MVKEGAADDSEQLQAEEILASARNTRLGYEEAWHQAEADYIQVVGAKPDDLLDFGAPVWETATPASIDVAVHDALATNPKIQSARKLNEALGKEAEAAKGDLVPRLSADMAYDRKHQSDDMGGMAKNASALLRMSWNFSTGGAEFARIGRGLDQREQALARRHQTERDVEHDVRQKFTSMQVVDEQFSVLAQREQDVQKLLDSFLKQFEAGKQSNLQLIAAHSKLFDAKASRTDAYYRRLLSRFEPLSVMGRLEGAFGITPLVVPAEDKVKNYFTPPPLRVKPLDWRIEKTDKPEAPAQDVEQPHKKSIFDVKGY
jgi:outer membrane protein TolC